MLHKSSVWKNLPAVSASADDKIKALSLATRAERIRATYIAKLVSFTQYNCTLNIYIYIEREREVDG